MDWLSRFLEIIPISGHLDIRCLYAAPWRLVVEAARPGEIPYHIIISGAATLEDPDSGSRQLLTAGDILLFPHGIAHALHDGSGKRPNPAKQKPSLNLTISKNAGKGDLLDMLCGHFVVPPPYDRLLQDYLPPRLIVHTDINDVSGVNSGSKLQLANLISLMRNDAISEKVGGHAMLNALSAAMFALTLRLAGESELARRDCSHSLALHVYHLRCPQCSMILRNRGVCLSWHLSATCRGPPLFVTFIKRWGAQRAISS